MLDVIAFRLVHARHWIVLVPLTRLIVEPDGGVQLGVSPLLSDAE